MSHESPHDADERDETQLARQRAFGEVVCRLREGEDGGKPLWSQAELAARAGLNVEYLDQLERGDVNPTLAVVCRLADSLDAPVTLLLSDLDGLAAPPGS